jgi:hypothetical protein
MHNNTRGLPSSRSTKSAAPFSTSSGSCASAGSAATNSLLDPDAIYQNFLQSIYNPDLSESIAHNQLYETNKFHDQQSFSQGLNNQCAAGLVTTVAPMNNSINSDLAHFVSNNASFVNSSWDNDDAVDDPDFTVCLGDLEDADLDDCFLVPSKN